MGKIALKVKCNVTGCGEDAVRSISTEKAKSGGLQLAEEGRRAYICKSHYKQLKKKMKKEKLIEKWRYMG